MTNAADILRSEGFTIHGRPPDGPPTWQRFGRGTVYGQADALTHALIILAHREQRAKEAVGAAAALIAPTKVPNHARYR